MTAPDFEDTAINMVGGLAGKINNQCGDVFRTVGFYPVVFSYGAAPGGYWPDCIAGNSVFTHIPRYRPGKADYSFLCSGVGSLTGEAQSYVGRGVNNPAVTLLFHKA